MDTAIIITGFIGLAAGLALGALFWGHHADTVAKQAEEIDALQSDNLMLRGQCSELATMAHDAADERDRAQAMLGHSISERTSLARRLSAAKGQITKLRRNV